MKALVKLKAEPGIWLRDEPMPFMGENDVLIKIKKTAICGTDIHIYNWDNWAQNTLQLPLITGHEFAGEIVDAGSSVKSVSIGQRVSGEGHLVCGHCRNCRAGRRHLCRNTKGIGVNTAGAFAEYLVMPQENIYPLSDSISDTYGAILDPLGNAAHTALEYNLVGEDVLITGAGPIGIMAAAIARHVGARHVVITDVEDSKLELAKKMGANKTINVTKESISQAMTDLGMKEGFDVGLEMSGQTSAFQDLIANMNYGGNVALLGIPPKDVMIDWNHVIFKGLNIKGIYGRKMFETWYKMTSMLQSGLDISPIITHEFHIDDFQEAFDTMLSGKSSKVILNWE